jgi:hypothetical protein
MNTDMIAPYPDNHCGPIHYPFVSDDFPHPIRDLPFDPIHNLPFDPIHNLPFDPIMNLSSFEPVPELPSLENTPELFQDNSLVNSMHHNQTNDWCIVQ